MSEHVLEHLSAYLDGELSDAERERFRAHLLACPECARRLEELAAVDGAFRELPEAAPPGYFETFPTRVRSRLAAAAVPTRPAWRLPVWALAAAAGLVVAVLAPMTLLTRARYSSPEQPRPAAAPLPMAEQVQPAPPPQTTPPTAALGVPATAAPPASDERLAAKLPVGSLEREEDKARRDNALARVAPPTTVPSAAAAPARAAGASQPAGFAVAPPQETQAPTGPRAAQQAELRKQEGAPAEAEVAAANTPPARTALRDRDAQERAAGSESKDQPAASERPPVQTDELGASAGRAASAGVAGGSLTAYRSLLDRSPRNADEARSLRESWRRLSAELAAPAEADAARVKVVEMGAAAWRLGRRAEDRDLLERDAAAYLQRADALQKERVRAALATTRP